MTTLSSNNDENLKENRHNADVKEELEDTSLPEGVLCDSCMDSPSKALKSCLTCMVSYCEAHLRPHLENVKFQNHRLVDPLHDFDCQACEVHQLPIKRFCLMDGSCVCLDCEIQEHEGHTISSVEEARAQIETELQKKHKEISESASSSVQEVCFIVEQQFSRLQTTVEEARKGVVEVLEGEQKKALKQAEGIKAHLEQRRAQLMKTLAQMNKLSKKKEVNSCVPSVHINRIDHLTSYVHAVTDASQELRDLILSTYKEKLSSICNSGKCISYQIFYLTSSLAPHLHLTFDPDTAHNFLRLMEDNRKLTNTSPWQHSYPEHPSRFEYWRQAITLESLYLGRHYIEAELSGEGAHVGVTYKSIDRKGEDSTSCITGNDFSWCMGRNSRGFSAWHAGVETVLEVTDITRIGLYLDFHRGSVSFYNVTGPLKLLHMYTTDFIEPLYITVWLSKKDNVVSLINAK
uniref:B30.2/SPRY domain-containing protein n=1 Tax=Amphiprion ocellaris TaxID=80972 RepID=A0AAQ5Y5A4_AMPOC